MFKEHCCALKAGVTQVLRVTKFCDLAHETLGWYIQSSQWEEGSTGSLS